MYTLPGHEEDLKTFFDSYTIERIIAPSTKFELKPKSERHCRFCKDKRQNIKFEGRSHLIPEFLGNEDLLSDFECDACNAYFAPMENHFANSLGMMRTLWALTRGGSVPKFPSPSGVHAVGENFYGVKGVGISRPEGSEGFTYNPTTGHFEVAFDKHSYVPLYVYKILLKLALSTIHEDEVGDYDRAFEFLMTKEKSTGWSQILSSTSPPMAHVKEPACILFRKREASNLQLTHIFMLSFENMTYQFPMWYNVRDLEIGLYKQRIKPMFCPPTFQTKPPPDFKVVREKVDLSSSEKIVREKGIISWDSDPKLMESLIAFHPETGEPTGAKFDADTIVRVHITNEHERPAFPFLDKKKNNDATHSDQS